MFSRLYTLILTAMCLFFFFNDTATTEIYTLSLHDALPIFFVGAVFLLRQLPGALVKLSCHLGRLFLGTDRKSTRLNSSHLVISYAVFCLKKKKKTHSDFSPSAASAFSSSSFFGSDFFFCVV